MWKCGYLLLSWPKIRTGVHLEQGSRWGPCVSLKESWPLLRLTPENFDGEALTSHQYKHLNVTFNFFFTVKPQNKILSFKILPLEFISHRPFSEARRKDWFLVVTSLERYFQICFQQWLLNSVVVKTQDATTLGRSARGQVTSQRGLTPHLSWPTRPCQSRCVRSQPWRCPLSHSDTST